MFYGGGLTADSSQKMEAFVELADTFHLPVVHLVDQPGFVIGIEAERAATIRHGARALAAVYQAQVPWCSIILRRVFGVGGAAHSDHTRVSVPRRLAVGRLGLAAAGGRDRGRLPGRARGGRRPRRAAGRDRRADERHPLAVQHGGARSASRRSSTPATPAASCASSPTSPPRCAAPAPSAGPTAADRAGRASRVTRIGARRQDARSLLLGAATFPADNRQPTTGGGRERETGSSSRRGRTRDSGSPWHRTMAEAHTCSGAGRSAVNRLQVDVFLYSPQVTITVTIDGVVRDSTGRWRQLLVPARFTGGVAHVPGRRHRTDRQHGQC